MNSLSDPLKPPPSSLSYLPQLDSVRAFAVGLVVWHHWWQPRHAPGALGVWIFFVLSGFLITRILLKSRSSTAAENRQQMLIFYIRRFLRIFPLYYFVLLLSFAASAAFRANWYWYVSYLQNFKIILAEQGSYIFGTHLWSLAVEEQFYIFWPLLTLFTPRRALLPMIICGIGIGVLSRYVCTQLGWPIFDIYVFTPNNFDTLGLGALLAYFVTYRPHQVVWLRRIALIVSVLIIAGAVVAKIHNGQSILPILPLPVGLLSLWMISLAAEGVPGPIGHVISWPVFIYIGRISYGIYVYHYFVPIVLQPVFERLGIAERTAPFVVICCIATMIVASLSWYLLENPINSLKSRFKMRSKSKRNKSDTVDIGAVEA
jgi:peptidoglycan/LPS O-acetylase OafA/YrhL